MKEPLTDEESDRIAAALVERSRAAQRLPPIVTDPDAIEALAGILAGAPRKVDPKAEQRAIRAQEEKRLRLAAVANARQEADREAVLVRWREDMTPTQFEMMTRLYDLHPKSLPPMDDPEFLDRRLAECITEETP